jgi:hypothetical protein
MAKVLPSAQWMSPVAKSAKGLRDEIDRVRTEPLQIQKASEEAASNQWWGRVESNHLPSGYEPPALTDELRPRLTYYSLYLHLEL